MPEDMNFRKLKLSVPIDIKKFEKVLDGMFAQVQLMLYAVWLTRIKLFNHFMELLEGQML